MTTLYIRFDPDNADSVVEAIKFLSRFTREGAMRAVKEMPDDVVESKGHVPTPEEQEKARKARKDAGQRRGKYKPRETAKADDFPEADQNPPPSTSGGQAEKADGAAPTMDEARAALKRLLDAKGTDAAQTALMTDYKVMRIGDLPAERRAEFIADVTKRAEG